MDISSGTTQLQFLADGQGRRLSKTFTPDGTQAYPQTTFFNQRIVEVDLTIESAMAALQDASAAGACFVRGIVNDRQAQGIRRLKGKVIARHETRLQCFDTDHFILPDFTGDRLDIEQVSRAVMAELGLTCSFIAQFSSSHGLKGHEVCLHIYVLTQEAHSDKALRTWAKTKNAEYHARYPQVAPAGKVVDPALFCDNQIHYIADPLFKGVPDPLEGHPRWAVIKGENAFWSGPPELPPVQRRERLKGVRCGAGAFREQVGKLAAGEIPDGVHAAVLEAAKSGSKTGLSAEEVIAVLAPAAHDGAIKAGREDALDRLAGGEVEKSVEWAFQNLSAEDEAANAGFELKSTFDLTLRALAHQDTERLAAAITTFNRFKRRAPKRQTHASLINQIATAARLNVSEREELERAAASGYAKTRGEGARRLDVEVLKEDALKAVRVLAVVRQNQIDSLAAYHALNPAREISHYLRPLRDIAIEVRHVATPADAAALILEAFQARTAAGIQAPLFRVIGRHGSGKTRIIFKSVAEWAAQQEMSVFALTPLRSLAAEQAGILNGVPYTTLKEPELCKRIEHDPFPFKMPYIPAVSAVQDSLTHPNLAKRMTDCGALLMDEMDHLVGAQGRDSQMSASANRQAKVQEVTMEALRRVPLVIGASADCSSRELAYLAQAERDILLVQIDTPDAPLAVGIHQTGVDGMIRMITQSVKDAVPVLIAVDSAQQVKVIEALCRELGLAPGEYRCIHAESEDNAEFFKDINSNVTGLKVLAYSPSMGSGVSITNGHFQRHLFGYCGAVSPTGAVQMIRRDRTMQHLDLFWIGNGTPPGATDEKTLILGLIQARMLAVEAKVTSPEDMRESDLQYASLTAEDNRSREDCQNALVYLLEARGAVIDYAADDLSEEDAEFADLVKEKCTADEIAAIETAADANPDEMNDLRALKNQGRLSRAELSIYKRGQIKRLLGLDFDAPLSTADIVLGLDKNTYARIARVEQALASDAWVAREAARDWNRASAKKIHPEPRRHLFRYVLGELYDALEGKAMTLTGAMAEGVIERLIEHEDFARFCGLSIPKPGLQRRTSFIIGLLGDFGISVTERRQRVGGEIVRVYDVEQEATSVILNVVARRAQVAPRPAAIEGMLVDDRERQRGWTHFATKRQGVTITSWTVPGVVLPG